MRIAIVTLALISIPTLPAAGILRVALTRTMSSTSPTCSSVISSGMIDMQQARNFSRRRSPASARRPLPELLAPYEDAVERIDPALLQILRTPIAYEDPDYENKRRLRTALLARVTGREFALDHLKDAIFAEDHELTEQLLASTGCQKILEGKFIDLAARTNKLEIVACVLKHAEAPWNEQTWSWGSYSAKTIKFLLAHGANISREFSIFDKRLRGDLSPSDRIFSSKFRRYWSNSEDLDRAEKIELLKKAIILAYNGDPFNFEVENPLSSKESEAKRRHSWPSHVPCYMAEGDWTFGAFPDLAKLIRALMALKEKSHSIAAQETIRDAMHRYDIRYEDVTVESKVPTTNPTNKKRVDYRAPVASGFCI